MANQPGADRQTDQSRQDEYVKGGKGRRDEVGGSGIYPASSPDAPADAELRSEGELVGHTGPHSTTTNDRAIRKTDGCAGSE